MITFGVHLRKPERRDRINSLEITFKFAMWRVSSLVYKILHDMTVSKFLKWAKMFAI